MVDLTCEPFLQFKFWNMYLGSAEMLLTQLYAVMTGN